MLLYIYWKTFFLLLACRDRKFILQSIIFYNKLQHTILVSSIFRVRKKVDCVFMPFRWRQKIINRVTSFNFSSLSLCWLSYIIIIINIVNYYYILKEKKYVFKNYFYVSTYITSVGNSYETNHIQTDKRN